MCWIASESRSSSDAPPWYYAQTLPSSYTSFCSSGSSRAGSSRAWPRPSLERPASGTTGGNEPGARVEQDALAALVRPQHGPQRLERSRSGGVVELIEQAAGDAHRAYEPEGVIAAGAQVDRLPHLREGDGRESRFGQDAPRRVGVGKPEGSRRASRRLRQRPAGGEGAAERQQPLVLAELLPGEERQAPAGPQGTADVPEGGDRVGEERGAEAADGDVERLVRERVHLGVGLLESDVRQPLGAAALAGSREHPRRQVHAERASRDRRARRVARRLTAPTPDVEHAIAGRNLRGVVQVEPVAADGSVV